MATKSAKTKEQASARGRQQTHSAPPLKKQHPGFAREQTDSDLMQEKLNEMAGSKEMAAMEFIFRKFFKQLEKTTINIRSNAVESEINSKQKKEFAKRSKSVDVIRNAYTAIDNETRKDEKRGKPKTKIIAKMDLDGYPKAK